MPSDLERLLQALVGPRRQTAHRSSLVTFAESLLLGTVFEPAVGYRQTILNDAPVFYWRLDELPSTAYSAAVLADTPVGYWRLGEASGTNAADASGNANAGTYTGGVTLGQSAPLPPESGVSNTAALFDGSSGYVSCPNLTVAAMTAECWVYPTSDVYAIVLSEEPAAYGTGWELSRINGTGQARFAINAGGLIDVRGGILPLNQWSHVAATYDGASASRLYVNGAQVGTNLVNTASPATPATVQIGRRPSDGSYWPGRLDEAAVYNTALSAARILAHYQAARPSTALDASGNGRIGTYVGGVVVGQAGPLGPDLSQVSDVAVLLDGASGYVNRTDEAALHLTTGSIEAWFKTTGSATAQVLGGNIGDESTGLYGTALYEYAGGVRLTVGNASAFTTCIAAGTYADGAWHHAAGTWDGTTLRVYVDGVLIASTAQTVAPAWNSYPFVVGRGANFNGYYLKGTVDEVAMYSSVLSAAQVLNHYNVGLSQAIGVQLATRGGATDIDDDLCVGLASP